jgi:hypothetical protein
MGACNGLDSLFLARSYRERAARRTEYECGDDAGGRHAAAAAAAAAAVTAAGDAAKNDYGDAR